MTDTAWRLRPLCSEDHERIAHLIRCCFAAQGVATDPPPSALKETAVGVAAMEGGAVAAQAEGTPVGVVLWAEREGGLYVGRLAVVPRWRRQGIARALLAAAEAEARNLGLARVFLSTRLALADNRRLFAGCGFVEIAQHAHPGYDHPTFVEAEKRLR
jgi:GNAT superfamily N-acetyltransferase